MLAPRPARFPRPRPSWGRRERERTHWDDLRPWGPASPQDRDPSHLHPTPTIPLGTRRPADAHPWTGWIVSSQSPSCVTVSSTRSAACRVQRLALRPLPIASRARNGQAPRIAPVLPRVSRSRASSKSVFAHRSVPQFAGQHVKAHGVTSRSRRSAVALRTGRVRLCSLLFLFTLHVLIVGESLKACPRR
jgi:hypothetical protein